jgi:IS1 family transposase
MNQLNTEDRARILAALVEGNSIRAIARMTGKSRNTIDKLLCDLGRACSEYQDKAFRNLSCKRVQCDEIWSFVGAKEKNCTAEMKAQGAGDVWRWVALDADTKLVPCWFIGQRHGGAAYHFMHDLSDRLANRVQLTTDGHRAYLNAVEDAFGANVDYAMLNKIYGAAPEGAEVRYSPAICMGTKRAVITASRILTTSQRPTSSARISPCACRCAASRG